MNCSVVLVVAILFAANATDPEVTISLGTLRGRRLLIHRVYVDEYLGVPFAKPPSNQLRFAKPQPITEKWKKTYVAQSMPVSCMQYNHRLRMSEDCLYLNIWKAENSKQLNSLQPVLFWIHGGGLTEGSSNQYNASILARISNCIVVTINYRLNVFGFLFANNTETPGNMGLYDQLLALQWVNENIEYFGGDKKRVTIFGESAGGWSTSLQLMSPLSHPYYKNAIVMSGLDMDYLGVDSITFALKRAKALALVVGCNYTGNASSLPIEVINCLRKKDANTILGAVNDLRVKSAAHSLVWTSPFLPVFGEHFLPSSPREIWKQKLFKPNTSLLIGTVYNEFVFNDNIKNRGIPSNLIRWFCARIIPVQFLTKQECEELIRIYYIGIDEVKDRQKAIQTMSDFYNDLVFHCPSIAFAEAFSEVNNVYQYFFTYKSKKDNPYCGPTFPCHGSDIPFTFGFVRNQADTGPTLLWMQIIATFAKTGKVFWPKYYKTKGKILVPVYYEFKGRLSAADTHVGLKEYNCRIWKSMILRRKSTIGSNEL